MSWKYAGPVPRLWEISKEIRAWLELIRKGNFPEIRTREIRGEGLSSDPDAAPDNTFVIWQSDGGGTGDDGDIMISITDSNGVTKTTTLVDYSGI